jgi:hypothetical protein
MRSRHVRPPAPTITTCSPTDATKRRFVSSLLRWLSIVMAPPFGNRTVVQIANRSGRESCQQARQERTERETAAIRGGDLHARRLRKSEPERMCARYCGGKQFLVPKIEAVV